MIKLKDVTGDNWEAVADLKVRKSQKNALASNLYSLAESKFNPYAIPKAIYAGRRLVGFLMYEQLHEDGKPHEYSIYRFMIDKKYQGKGYGRLAMQKVLDLIREDKELRRITICYVPENKTAKAFYASFGFKEVGLDDYGEMIAEIIV